MHNGDDVVYTGQETDGLVPGARGHVLSCTAAYAHVQWLDGARAGDVGLHRAEDLCPLVHPNAVTASLDDSLEVGSLVSMASAQEAYEETGGEGLVAHLASAGYLAAYSSVAEEALQLIASSLRQDPVLRQLSAAMDPDEAEDVFRRAATALLTESGDF